MPDNSIQALTQGKDGHLWIGTARGLARFDGARFTVWDRNNTLELKADNIRHLAEDREGNLWIGTTAGVVRKSGTVFTRFTNEDGSETFFETADVLASKDGSVWIAHRLGLVRHERGVFKRFGKDADYEKDILRCLHEDKEGVIWAGTWDGLMYLDSSGALQHVDAPDIVGNRSVAALAAAPDGGLLVLFYQHQFDSLLYHFNKGRWRPMTDGLQMDGRSVFFASTHEGDVWMSLDRGFMHRLRNGRTEQFPFELEHPLPFPLCALEDQEGNLWIGTEQNGLHRWRPREIDSLDAGSGLVHDNVWSILEARDGAIWIGTDGGLSRYQNGSFTNWTKRDGLPRSDVRALAEDDSGNVWIGTGSGLVRYASGELETHRFAGEWFNSKVRALLPDRRGQLWVGTAKGLHRVHLARDQAASGDDGNESTIEQSRVTTFQTTEGLPDNDVSALLEDHSGALWIGTSAGAARIQDGRMEQIDRVPRTNVGALCEDTEGALWIVAERTLHRFVDGVFTAFTAEEGLPDDMLNGVIDDQRGNLWLSGDRGVYRIPKADFAAVARGEIRRLGTVAYTAADGLPASETNGQKCQPSTCRTRDGQLWFPTSKGVLIFDPGRLPDNTAVPPVVIEQVRANGLIALGDDPGAGPRIPEAGERLLPAQNRTGGRTLQLRPGEGHLLEIQYAVNSFVATERARFKYRLDGLDRDWVDAGSRRTAYYTDLSPGTYRFQVIAANGHGVWNHTGDSLVIRLAPRFYQSLWFQIVCGMLAAAALSAGYRWRVGELRHRQRLAQGAALAEERERIAKDLHDGLGANLTQITLLADLAETEPPDAIAHRARTLAKTARETSRALKDFLWATQPADESFDGLVTRICQYAEQFLEPARVRCRFELAGNLPVMTLTPTQRKNLFLAATEAFTNVVRHAHATEVWIRTQSSGGAISLTIEDNGKGFNPQNPRGQGRGLGNMESRVRQTGGQFHLESQPERGTTVCIQISVPSTNR